MIPPPQAQCETPSERVALVAWHLAHGEGLTTQIIAGLTGLSPRGARELMYRISRVIPIYIDDDGFWQVCALREAEQEAHTIMIG